MPDFVPGLEGVIAFQTEIAEPDKDGGSLRYRGVDIEQLVGQTSFGDVWGLLVDLMRADTEKHIDILRFILRNTSGRRFTLSHFWRHAHRRTNRLPGRSQSSTRADQPG